MAHAWVQMFDSEYDAFKTYCQIYPHNATLLVDTYNTLKSGVPNAIRAFNEVLKPMGKMCIRDRDKTLSLGPLFCLCVAGLMLSFIVLVNVCVAC